LSARLSGEEYEVTVRKSRVDATYLEPAVPSTYAPPFAVAPEARCVPLNELSKVHDCAAAGLNPAPAIAIFSAGCITPQPIRTGLIPFNAALVGFVEATRDDVAEKNRLCPTNRLPDVPLDWVRGTLVAMTADHLWSREPDIASWLERARLNPSRGIRQRSHEPRVQQASRRFAENVRPALQNLQRLLG
jgi:hypothetical protein